jgi:hypothetical protein
VVSRLTLAAENTCFVLPTFFPGDLENSTRLKHDLVGPALECERRDGAMIEQCVAM